MKDPVSFGVSSQIKTGPRQCAVEVDGKNLCGLAVLETREGRTSQLLKDSFIACGELDPINRRLSSLKRPEVVVQVVVLAKDEKIKDILQQAGYQSKTLKEVTNIEVHPARVLSHLYTFLGRSEKLGLSGRHR